MEKSVCSKCKETKAVSDFWKSRAEKNGLDYFCIPCRKEHWRREYAKNPDRFKRCSQNYLEQNREKVKKRRQLHYERNRERLIAQSKSRQTQYDPAAILLRRRERYKHRMATDPIFHLSCSLRGRFKMAIKRISASKIQSVIQLCGCSLELLKRHLEKQFKPGMSWENYGKFGWHIDHVKPCSKFDLSDFEEQRKCFHFTNLQPLWVENLSKAARI